MIEAEVLHRVKEFISGIGRGFDRGSPLSLSESSQDRLGSRLNTRSIVDSILQRTAREDISVTLSVNSGENHGYWRHHLHDY